MRYSARVQRVAGEGAAAWDIHYQALKDQQTDEQVIVLSVGDPDFATPGEITNAGVQALLKGDTHYTPILGRDSLRAAIANSFKANTGLEIKKQNIAVLAGAQNALFAASLCLFSPGDEVIAFDPMYLTYDAYIGVSGAEVVRLAGQANDGFRPNVEALQAAVTPRTKAIAFSNPNNPSGMVMTAAELEAIAQVAIDNDLWVISDEVYAAFTFEQAHLSIAALANMQERTITVSSLSKSHAMTGWRLGWMIAPAELVQHVENMALCMLYGLPGFIQEAGVEALTNSLGASDEMRDIYRARRDLVCQELSPISGLKVLAPEAGMFVLVDVSASGKSAAKFAEELYQDQKVSVLDGAAFGQNIAHCIRISFTSGESTLRDACQRIRRYMSRLS